MKTFKTKSFTLIELLVVIAIIGLLVIIIAIPINRARRGASIARILQYEASLHRYLGSDIVGWWQFNEGEGSVAYDISGHNNHGTLVNNPQWVDGVPGKEGYALEFDGNNYISMSNDVGNFTSRGTLSVWVKSNRDYPSNDENNRFRGIISKTSGGGQAGLSYYIDWYGSNTTRNFRARIGNGSVNQGFTIHNFNFGDNWMHLTYSWDGSYHNLYINGNAKTPIPQTINAQILETSFDIGRAFKTSYSWDGKIDDVRIYNNALTSEEINNLYTETKDKYLAEEI